MQSNWTITTKWLADQIRKGRKPRIEHFSIGNKVCVHVGG